jgi:hypothetical protein
MPPQSKEHADILRDHTEAAGIPAEPVMQDMVDFILTQLPQLTVSQELLHPLSGYTIIYTANSGESYGFTIQAGEQRFFLRLGKVGLKQSYLDEQQQLTELSVALHKDCEKARIRFPQFVRAREQWCLMEYVQGTPLTTLQPSQLQFLDKVEAFLNKNRQRALFSSLQVDMMPTNFIQMTDGSLVWLDPFYVD